MVVFNILVFIYQIIIEVFSAIFSIEGIQIDKAKFQIISIITGTGFTTHESELMLITKKRRKLTQIMILFSYIFNISIVTTIVNVFISSEDTNIWEIKIGILLTIINFILLLILNKASKIRTAFDNFVKKTATKVREKRNNPISIYDYYGDKIIAEVTILKLNEKISKLNTSKLKENYNIDLLAIRRGEETISDLRLIDSIDINDVLLLFGEPKKIKSLFKIRTKK